MVVPRLVIVFSASNMTVRCPFLAEQAEPIAVPLLKIGLVVSFHCYSESLCALSPSQSLSLSRSVFLSLSLSLFLSTEPRPTCFVLVFILIFSASQSFDMVVLIPGCSVLT